MRPKCLIPSILPIVIAAVLPTANAPAEEPKQFQASLSAAYYNKYVWRGQNINDTGVLQTSVSGSAHGFTGSIWANIDLTNGSHFAPQNAGDFSEIDYALDYSRPLPGFPKIGFSLGVIHYLFPNTASPSTTEVYGGLSFSLPASPKIVWYRDVNMIDGSYIQLTAGHTFEKIAAWNDDYRVGLSLSGSLAAAGRGYNRGYFGVDAVRFNDITLGIGLPLTLKHVTFTPSLNLSGMLSKQIGDAAYERKRSNVWMGIGFSKSF